MKRNKRTKIFNVILAVISVLLALIRIIYAKSFKMVVLINNCQSFNEVNYVAYYYVILETKKK